MTRVPRGRWARQDKRVIKETKGCQGWWDLKERKVLLDHWVGQGQRVQPGLEVFQGPKGQEGLEADLETLVRKVTLGIQDLLVGTEWQAFRDRQGLRGREEQQVPQGWRGLVVLLDLSALLDLPDYQGCLRLYFLPFQSLLSPLGLLRSLNPQNHLNLPNQQWNKKAPCPGRSSPLWPLLQHPVSSVITESCKIDSETTYDVILLPYCNILSMAHSRLPIWIQKVWRQLLLLLLCFSETQL